MTERREDPQPEPGHVTPDAEVEAASGAAGAPALDRTADRAPDAASEPTAEELSHARPARVRHAPRFGRFIGTAVALGLLIGLVLATVIPAPQGVGLFLAWAYLGLPLALVFGLVTGVAAVVIDRRS